ncbi:hypothetical protein [Pandoraea vervacti]|uniref:hypothetical protein n=1 Tax=Pandoraea vervacti TaxID=656178 RepID=UPI001C54D7BC|nr:hypothetical protein [Pandoraea vervacti]
MTLSPRGGGPVIHSIIFLPLMYVLPPPDEMIFRQAIHNAWLWATPPVAVIAHRRTGSEVVTAAGILRWNAESAEEIQTSGKPT